MNNKCGKIFNIQLDFVKAQGLITIKGVYSHLGQVEIIETNNE